MRSASLLFLVICLFVFEACTPQTVIPTLTPINQADGYATLTQSAENATQRSGTRLANQANAYYTFTALSVTDTPAATSNLRLVTNTPIAEAQAFPTNTERPSNTPEPTNTEEPTATDRPTRAPQPTDTERPSRTPEPTDTERPSRTPRPTEVDTDTYYVTGSTANVRSCADSACDRLTTLSYGEDIEVIEQVQGVAPTSGSSTKWYRVLLNDGREGFIHSSLVSETRPVAGTSGNSGNSGSSGGSSNNSGSSGGSTGSTTNVQPTEVPQQQSQPTQPPPPPAPVGYTCDCNKTCGAMTCEEAYFQLNSCGCGARDNDNDGVPCESVCPGG